MGQKSPHDNPAMRRFGRELARLRTMSGLSQRALGRETSVSGSLIGHYERAERNPNKGWVERADEVLDADGSLVALWPEVLRSSYPEYAGTFMEAVPQASLLRDYHPLLVPGLLQTRDYAYALIKASNPMETEDFALDLVEKRIARQEVVHRSSSPVIWTIITEGVIRDLEGDPDILTTQVDHLIELMDRGRVRLQVVPATVRFREHPGLDGAFSLLSLPNRQEVLYAEGPVSGSMVTDSGMVEWMSLKFGSLQSVALPPNETREFLKEVRGKVDGHTKLAQVELQQWGRGPLRGGPGGPADGERA
ncbi:helix-turn-helix domain-containing protein [Nocardiopsis salina]|uniref:helix-turn-helix domain-containing protein n=1 Tax=Nocardiopsis salina TaxID=245836 RepID=UPI003083F108